MSGFPRRCVIWVTSVAMMLGGIALGATVFASGPAVAAAGTGAPRPPAPPVPPEQRGPLFAVVHGELQLTTYEGEALSLVYDRGMITSKTEAEITLVRLDGQTVTVGIDAETFVRDGLRVSSLDALHVGDRAMFFSKRTDGDSLHAVLIRCITFLPPPGAGAPGAPPASTTG